MSTTIQWTPDSGILTNSGILRINSNLSQVTITGIPGLTTLPGNSKTRVNFPPTIKGDATNYLVRVLSPADGKFLNSLNITVLRLPIILAYWEPLNPWNPNFGVRNWFGKIVWKSYGATEVIIAGRQVSKEGSMSYNIITSRGTNAPNLIPIKVSDGTFTRSITIQANLKI
jgi:hypothetical protein